MTELNFEVWYQFKNNEARKIAAFRFRFEAEKYIEIFHAADKEYWTIVDNDSDVM